MTTTTTCHICATPIVYTRGRGWTSRANGDTWCPETHKGFHEPRDTYAVDVTPKWAEHSLAPVYEYTIHRNGVAGICGPFTESSTVFSIADLDQDLMRLGFQRVGDFGPICGNGFATSPLVRNEDVE